MLRRSVRRSLRLLVGSLAALGCGPAVPEYTLVHTASGRAIALEETSEVRLTDGRPALLLSYRSDVDLEDRAALQIEVDAVWENFRPAVEAAGRQRAVLRARRLDKPGWQRRIQVVQFVVERAPGGSWRARNGDDELAVAMGNP